MNKKIEQLTKELEKIKQEIKAKQKIRKRLCDRITLIKWRAKKKENEISIGLSEINE